MILDPAIFNEWVSNAILNYIVSSNGSWSVKINCSYQIEVVRLQNLNETRDQDLCSFARGS